MIKVNGLNELAQMIEYNEIVRNHINKAEKAIKKQRTAELMALGIDAEIAKVMASVGL